MMLCVLPYLSTVSRCCGFAALNRVIGWTGHDEQVAERPKRMAEVNQDRPQEHSGRSSFRANVWRVLCTGDGSYWAARLPNSRLGRLAIFVADRMPPKYATILVAPAWRKISFLAQSAG